MRELAVEVRALAAAQEVLNTRLARAQELNRTDMRAVDVMLRRGPITAGALATELGVTTGAVTGVLNRLEAAGHASRLADAADRRRVVVSASAEARSAADRRIDALRREMWTAMADLDDAKLDVATEVLRRVRRAVENHCRRLEAEETEA